MDFRKVKNIINENQDLLAALEESDRTGKLRKISYKERISLTIDENLMHKFRNYCKKNGLKASGQVEIMIKEFLRKKK